MLPTVMEYGVFNLTALTESPLWEKFVGTDGRGFVIAAVLFAAARAADLCPCICLFP